MADTHHKPDTTNAAKKPHTTEVLHQRRNLPYSPYTMALGGFLVVATIGYFTLYAKKKPEARARDVARVSGNVAHPDETHPRVNPRVEASAKNVSRPPPPK